MSKVNFVSVKSFITNRHDEFFTVLTSNGCAVGLSETAPQNNIVVYPNPVSQMLTVETNLFESNFQLYNSFGELIYTTKPTSQKSTIDLSRFEAGIYYVKLNNNSGLTIIITK